MSTTERTYAESVVEVLNDVLDLDSSIEFPIPSSGEAIWIDLSEGKYILVNDWDAVANDWVSGFTSESDHYLMGWFTIDGEHLGSRVIEVPVQARGAVARAIANAVKDGPES